MTAVYDESGAFDVNATFYTLNANTATINLFQKFFSTANLTQVCIISVSFIHFNLI